MPGPQAPNNEVSQPERIVSVLAVTDSQHELAGLGEIFDRSNWKMYAVRFCSEALNFLRNNRVPVVVCARDLPDGVWTDLLSHLDNIPDPPVLIVTSRQADEALWAEVLNLGGYDVLPQPFEKSEVVRVISLAWLHWKSQKRQARRAVGVQTRTPHHISATA